MRALRRTAVGAGGLLVALAAQSQQYILTDLTALYGAKSGTANGISQNGTVVGIASFDGVNSQGFVYRSGTVASVGLANSAPFSVNNAGQITGDIYNFSNTVVTQGFLAQGATQVNLSTQPGALKGTDASGINASGQVAGSVYTQANNSGVATLAAVYSGGAWTQMGTLPGDTQSAAAAINDAGTVVGLSLGNTQRGFVYTGGMMTALDSLVANGDATPSAINSFGEIAGGAENTRGGQDAVYWTGTSVHDLGTLGGFGSVANGINDSGVIVGDSGLSQGMAQHAFVDRDGTMQDLNTLVVGKDGFSYLDAAFGVNDAGQIVGEGIMPDGTSHAFLLSPVPEPETYALMLAGLGLIGYVARRRQR